jgi:hypothetical protein
MRTLCAAAEANVVHYIRAFEGREFEEYAAITIRSTINHRHPLLSSYNDGHGLCIF